VRCEFYLANLPQSRPLADASLTCPPRKGDLVSLFTESGSAMTAKVVGVGWDLMIGSDDAAVDGAEVVNIYLEIVECAAVPTGSNNLKLKSSSSALSWH
jgi:hypothetical protein